MPDKKSLKFIGLLFAALVSLLPQAPAGQEEAEDMLEKLHWLGHASFRLDGPKTIYFDPWKVSADSKKADVVFISHDHFDHLSPEDIKTIGTKDTIIVCDAASAKQLGAKTAYEGVRAAVPGDKFEVAGLAVEVVPAYNTNKEFHTKQSRKSGYVVVVSGVRIYHAGDTDFIPEMRDIKCDIALLPVSGTYVMTADEAAEAALAIRPGVCVPMHYGDIVGSEADARRLKDLLKDKVEVRILRKER